jgi:uracil DNA glycosylase superfamily protein
MRRSLIDRLVDDLARVTIGRTFNQYRDSGAEDRDPSMAAPVRVANLRAYLRGSEGCSVLAVAEAAGWRGARYTGIPLLSERQIDEEHCQFRRTSTHPRGFAEPSATIVRGVLREGGWERHVLVWNAVPTHPFAASPHSNRPPTRAEVQAGRDLLIRLAGIVRPRHVVALGRTAAAAIPAEMDAAAVRHPAQGGATLCRVQLRALLARWLG